MEDGGDVPGASSSATAVDQASVDTNTLYIVPVRDCTSDQLNSIYSQARICEATTAPWSSYGCIGPIALALACVGAAPWPPPAADDARGLRCRPLPVPKPDAAAPTPPQQPPVHSLQYGSLTHVRVLPDKSTAFVGFADKDAAAAARKATDGLLQLPGADRALDVRAPASTWTLCLHALCLVLWLVLLFARPGLAPAQFDRHFTPAIEPQQTPTRRLPARCAMRASASPSRGRSGSRASLTRPAAAA